MANKIVPGENDTKCIILYESVHVFWLLNVLRE